MLYAGNVSAQESFENLKQDENAVLIDVRTRAEWQYAGVPDLACIDRHVLLLEWQSFPSMEVNSNFAHQFSSAVQEHGFTPATQIYSICRTGARSMASSSLLTEMGFEKAFNVSDGMYGPANDSGQRGKISGWIASDLPWRHL